jgi:acyl carrier protein
VLPRPARARDGSASGVAVDPERLRQVAELVELVTGTPAARVRAEQRFVDDLRVDSLSMIEVLEGCELRLGVHVPDAVTRQLVHVGDLVDYLARQDRRTPQG